MKRLKALYVVVMLFSMAGFLYAADAWWIADEHGVVGEASWSNADYWWTGDAGGIPEGGPDGSGWMAGFNHANLVVCTLDTVVTVNQVKIAEGGAGHLKILSGGSLTTGDVWSLIGAGAGGVGTLEVDGGSFTTLGNDGHLWIGGNSTGGAVGNVIVRGGGTITVGQGAGGAQFGLGWDGGTGNALIEDGLLWVANWAEQSITAGSNMNITGGTVRIKGHRIDAIETMVGDGRITGYGIADLAHVVVEWDAVNEETVLTAVPEPATMALLGFGGLALLRKKK